MSRSRRPGPQPGAAMTSSPWILVAAGVLTLGGVDDLFDALTAAGGELELVAVRGTEERTVVAHFN